MFHQAGRSALLIFVALIASAVAVPMARGHDEAHRLAGDKLKMSFPPDSTKRKFSFKTKRQLQIFEVSQDLGQTASNLVVRGAGPDDGDTGVIHLSPQSWRRIGKPEKPKGWKYRGDWREPGSSGLHRIVIKKGPNGGRLAVKARGPYWPYSILAPQQSVHMGLLLGAEQYCAEFSPANAEFKKNEMGKVMAKDATPPADCLAVCGNGKLEFGEQCDDGDPIDGNSCSNSCVGEQCTGISYNNTMDAIQALIFDSPAYQCSNDACHGAASLGGLDLRAGASHAQLINVPSAAAPATMRVFAGDQDLSMLYMKVAAKSLGTPTVPGAPMPVGATALTVEHLSALKEWIRGGAPAEGVVAGTEAYLDGCFAPPSPNKIPPPDPPALGEGVQFAMPGWFVEAQTEDEACFPSYYDFSAPGLVPDGALVDCPGAFPATNETGPLAGKCFVYGGQMMQMDAQSHHVIIHIYRGDYDTTDPGWGPWTCFLGDNAGQACDPTQAGACVGGICGGAVKSGAACNGSDPFGPPDISNPAVYPAFGGAQESTNVVTYPDGVYSVLPLKGIIVWNSHVFNLTYENTHVEGWLNLDFTANPQFPLQGLFEIRNIFVQNVPVFESRTYCSTETLPQGTNLFQLTSHTHRHGKWFRYYLPPQEPCQPGGMFTPDPNCLPGNINDVFYESYDYKDPLYLDFEPPMVLSGTVQDRTVKYCAMFDNGESDPSEVKRQSTSPEPPPGVTQFFNIGGPCKDDAVKCLGGPNQGQLCDGNDANCPDSVCDACDLKGGLRTEDEMFIPIGSYFIQ